MNATAENPLTHKEAVRRMVHWMRNSMHCKVVMAELKTDVTEIPDVLGWHDFGSSLLVECKVTRADFLADKKKYFRLEEDFGMGDLRYFATPAGLLNPEELPEGWGLLEIHAGRIIERVKPGVKPGNKRNEVKMLMSAIRRLEISTAVFVQQEEES